MFFVYILFSLKISRLYIGQTNNVSRRFNRHNQGRCLSTKSFRPWLLIYSEVCDTRSEAIQKEKYLKSLKSPEAIYKYIFSKRLF